MKKHIIYLALLLGVVAIAVLVFANRSSTLAQRETNFAVFDTSSIVRIFMADKQGNSVLLERNEQNIWYVNKEHLAQQSVVKEFLRTLMYVTVRAPVAISSRDNVIRYIASFGTKVEIYQKKYLIDLWGIQLFPRVKKIKCYYVGDNTQDNSGTYMIMEGSQNPYITYIPGFYGFLHTRYSTNPYEWRDHTIFNHLLTDIKSVQLIHTQDPEKSFQIENPDNKNFVVYTLKDGRPLKDMDTLKVITYLNSFYDARFEYFVKDNILKDSLLRIEPSYHLTLVSKQNDTIELKAYLKPNEYDEEQLQARFFETSDYPWDRERLWAIVGNPPEVVVIQYFVFGRILKPIDFFRKGYKEKLLEGITIYELE